MLLVKDGFLVDPVSGRNGVFDILIEDGHVAEVDTCIEVKDSYEVIESILCRVLWICMSISASPAILIRRR